MFTDKILRLYNPVLFQGKGKSKRYFEGWYIKLVAPGGSHALAIIPGISIDKLGNKNAFIQLLDGKGLKSYYEVFPFESFHYADKIFEINIGDNFFSNDKIILNLPMLKGTIHMEHHKPWPSKLLSPGVMGWFSFMPFMQCYHGVVSMHHHLMGTLQYNNKNILFDYGNGYMEKDWGRSFPQTWIWTQCNNYNTEVATSAMVSIAKIPWLGKYFIGHLGGFQLDDELYRYATYTGAKFNVKIIDKQVHLHLWDKNSSLEIIATSGDGAHLYSPLNGNMTGKVNESLLATHELCFNDFNKNIRIEAKGHSAGLEVAGPVNIILEGLK